MLSLLSALVCYLLYYLPWFPFLSACFTSLPQQAGCFSATKYKCIRWSVDVFRLGILGARFLPGAVDTTGEEHTLEVNLSEKINIIM
jgi:hypothetical protein